MTKNELDEILKSNSVTVVEFGAEWCGPCRTMEPIMREIASEFEGKAKVLPLDIEDNDEITTSYRVRNIPMVLYFKDGELKDKMVGAQSKSTIADKINSLID